MIKLKIDTELKSTMRIKSDVWDLLSQKISGCAEITTNVAVGTMIMDLPNCVQYQRTEAEREAILSNRTKPYKIATIDDLSVIVDPMMRWDDTRVLGEGIEILIEVDPAAIV